MESLDEDLKIEWELAGMQLMDAIDDVNQIRKKLNRDWTELTLENSEVRINLKFKS